MDTATQQRNMMTDMTNQQSYPEVPNHWYTDMSIQQSYLMNNNGSYVYNCYEAFRPKSPPDLFWIQNSGFFLDTKIIIFLDFYLKFLIFSGCPTKLRNLVSFAGVSILHAAPIYFCDAYFVR